MFQIRTYVQLGELISCKWWPNGSTAPVVIGKGVASVARTGTGKYRLTFIKPFRNVVAGQHTLTSASATSPVFLHALVGDGRVGVSSSAYVDIQHTVNGVAADIAASASTGTFVSSTFVVTNSKDWEG